MIHTREDTNVLKGTDGGPLYDPGNFSTMTKFRATKHLHYYTSIFERKKKVSFVRSHVVLIIVVIAICLYNSEAHKTIR